MNSYQKIIIPFLMGQRREGLRRVEKMTAGPWISVDIPSYHETDIQENSERLARMGAIYARLSEVVCDSVKRGRIPVTIAGDCVSAIGFLAGLQKAGNQPDRILWLDAHGDFHTWQTSRTRYIGGMPLAMLVGRGDRKIVDATGLTPYPEERIILSDGRDLDDGEREALEDSHITRCMLKDIPGHLNAGQRIYLHWDTDVIDDEKNMPALKYHVKQGPSFEEIEAIFGVLKGMDIVGISVSAWHEEKDRENTTAIRCLCLLEALGVNMATRK